MEQKMREYRYRGRHRKVSDRDAVDVVAHILEMFARVMMRGALAMWGWTTRHWVEGGLVSSVMTIAALLIFENSHAAEPTPTVLAPSAIVVTLPTPFPAATEANR